MLIIDKVKVVIQGNFLFTLSPSFFKPLKDYLDKKLGSQSCFTGNTRRRYLSLLNLHYLSRDEIGVILHDKSNNQ